MHVIAETMPNPGELVPIHINDWISRFQDFLLGMELPGKDFVSSLSISEIGPANSHSNLFELIIHRNTFVRWQAQRHYPHWR